MVVTAANTSAPIEDACLSKAELRRRRILAKKGARMALVTGDQTLATSDATAVIPPPTARISRSTQPTPVSTPSSTSDTNSTISEPAFAPIPITPLANMGSGRKMGSVPVYVRTFLVILCGALLPFIRASSTTNSTLMSASALQIFLGVEALFIAPELVSWSNMGMLGTLLGVAKHLSSVWRDASMFLFALFVSLRFQ